MTMIGIDTSFLVAIEGVSHPRNFASRELLDQFGADNERLALSPDVLSEFVHVITDLKRLEDPLSMTDAIDRAMFWWSAKDVQQVITNNDSVQLFFDWMRAHRLGRKRIRDTLLAASYFTAGVTRIVTLNGKDFEVFGCFEIIEPAPAAPPA